MGEVCSDTITTRSAGIGSLSSTGLLNHETNQNRIQSVTRTTPWAPRSASLMMCETTG